MSGGRHFVDDPTVPLWDETRELLSDEAARALREARTAAYREDRAAAGTALETLAGLVEQARELLTEIGRSTHRASQ
jgi:hypothetical protein